MSDATAGMSDYGEVMWRPSEEEIRSTNLASFVSHANRRRSGGGGGLGLDVRDYPSLHRWSVDRFEEFWEAYAEWGGMRFRRRGHATYEGPRACVPGGRWWPGCRFNYAENLLLGPAAGAGAGGPVSEPAESRARRVALVSRSETRPREEVTYGELRERVGAVRRSLRRVAGLGKGGRCFLYMANITETVVASLAVHAVGGVVSTCSPDFGTRGAMARIGQVRPSVLVAVDGYVYNGKRFDILPRLREIAALASDGGYLEHVVIVPYLRPPEEVRRLVAEQNAAVSPPRAASWTTWASLAAPPPLGEEPEGEEFEPVGESDALYVMFSSGTTGRPKCIVHSAIGVLAQIGKEHHLHMDLRPGDRFIYFTTCGWMVWNYLIAGLFTGCTVVIYDGSPVRTSTTCWDIVEGEGVTVLGLSARYVQLCEKKGLKPRETHNLDSLRAICVSASVLPPRSFRYVYRDVKADVRLSSQSGGTDLLSAFLGVNPVVPVHCGELQPPCLGMDVDVYDVNGAPTREGIGELVCKTAFPSMPLCFLDDPDGERYRAAYFNLFPNVWAQGDLAVWRPSGGMVLLGRSDSVLNPGGVRIGTAEIYQSLGAFDDVADSVAISFTKEDGDVAVILFVQMAEPGRPLTEDLKSRIRDKIRRDNTPRHVPHLILPCPQVPRTRTMKVSETAVRDCIHGRRPPNTEALADPKALDFFVAIADELRSTFALTEQSRL